MVLGEDEAVAGALLEEGDGFRGGAGGYVGVEGVGEFEGALAGGFARLAALVNVHSGHHLCKEELCDPGRDYYHRYNR